MSIVWVCIGLFMMALWLVSFVMACRALVVGLNEEAASDSNAEDGEPVSFDIERMKKAMEGERYMLPDGLSGEEICEHLINHAKKLRGEL